VHRTTTRRQRLLATLAVSLAVGCSADDSVSGTGTRSTPKSGSTATKATATPAAGPTATPAGSIPAQLQPRLFQPGSGSSATVSDAQKLYEALLTGAYYSFIETAENGLQFVGQVATKQGSVATAISVSYQDASGRKAAADGQVLTRSGIAYVQVELTAASGEKAIYRMARIGSDLRGTLETRTANGTKVVLGAVWRTTPPAATETRFAPSAGGTGNGTGAGAFGFGAGTIVQSGAAGLPSVALLPGVNAGIQIDAQTPTGGGVAGFVPSTGDGGAVADAPGTGGVVTVANPSPAPTAPALPPNLADEVIPAALAPALAEQNKDVLVSVFGFMPNATKLYAYAETASNGLQFFSEVTATYDSTAKQYRLNTKDQSGREGSGTGKLVTRDGFTFLEFDILSVQTDERAIFRVAKFGNEYRGTMETVDAQGRLVVIGVVWKAEAPLPSQTVFAPTPGTPGSPVGVVLDGDTERDPGSYGFGAGNIINSTQVDIPSTALIPGVNSGVTLDPNTSDGGTGGFIPSTGAGGFQQGQGTTGGSYTQNPPSSGTSTGGISGSESSTTLPGNMTPAPGQVTPAPILTPMPMPLPTLPPALASSDPDILTPSQIQQQVDPTPEEVLQGLGTVADPGHYFVFVETQSNGLQFIGEMDTAFEGNRVALGWTDPSGRKASGSGIIKPGVIAYLEGVMGSSLGDGATFRVARFGSEYRGTMETVNAKGERVIVGVVWRTQGPVESEQVFKPDAGTNGNTQDSGSYGFGSGEVLNAGQADVPTTVLIPGVNGGLDPGSTEVKDGATGSDGLLPSVGPTLAPDFPPYVPGDAPAGTGASDSPVPTPLPIQTAPPNLASATIIPVNSAGIISDLAAFQNALGTPQSPASFYVYVESVPNIFLGQLRAQFLNDDVTFGYRDTANRQATGMGRVGENRQGIDVLETRLVSNFGDYGTFRMVRYNDEFRGTLEVLANDGTRVVVGCVWSKVAPVASSPYSPVYGKDGNDDPTDWGFGAGSVILSRQVAVPSTVLIEGANGGILIDNSTTTALSSGFVATDTAGGTTTDAPGVGGVYVPGAPAPTPTPDPFYQTVTPEPLPSYSPVPGLQPTPAPTNAPVASPTPGSGGGVATPTPAPSVAPTPGSGFATPTPMPSSTRIPGPGEPGFVSPTPFNPATPTPAPSSTKIPGPGESGFVPATSPPSATPTPAPSSTKIPAPGESGFVPATSPPTATPAPTPSGGIAVPPGDGGPTPSPLPTGGGGASSPVPPGGGLPPGHEGGMGTPAPTPAPSGAPMDPAMGGGMGGSSSPSPTASPVPTPDVVAPPAGGGSSASPSPTPPPAHGVPGSQSAPKPDWRFVRPPKVW